MVFNGCQPVLSGYQCFSIATSSYFGMQCHHYHVFSKCSVLLLVFNFAFHCRLSLLIEMVVCKFLCTCAMLLVNNIKPPNKMHYESYPAQYEICSDLLLYVHHCTAMVTMQWFSMVHNGSQPFSMVLNHCKLFSIVHSSSQWLPVVLNVTSGS